MPESVRRLAQSLSVPPGAKVAGVAATADGQRLTDKPITNGTVGQVVDNAVTLRTDLAPWRLPGNVGLTHVEGHVAAMVRERVRESGKSLHVDLVVSRPPCPGVWGCRTLLADLLPVGSSTAVYVRGSDGSVRYFDTYHGNGNGVRT